MKKLLGILVLGLLFVSTPSQADDISDLQIEGMSVGDSLLDFFSEEEIKNTTVDWYKSNRYTSIQILNHKNFKTYEELQILFETKDSSKKIAGIDGIINYIKNIDECYKRIDEVVQEISNIVKDLKDLGKATYKHDADETGKSTVTDYVFENKNSDEIQIGCYDYSESHGGEDHFRIGIRLIALRNWIRNEAFK